MVRTTVIVLLVLVFAMTASAADMMKEFTFKTVDGKTIEYRALRGAPLVINIAAYW